MFAGSGQFDSHLFLLVLLLSSRDLCESISLIFPTWQYKHAENGIVDALLRSHRLISNQG